MRYVMLMHGDLTGKRRGSVFEVINSHKGTKEHHTVVQNR
jgi:hypothetical protein